MAGICTAAPQVAHTVWSKEILSRFEVARLSGLLMTINAHQQAVQGKRMSSMTQMVRGEQERGHAMEWARRSRGRVVQGRATVGVWVVSGWWLVVGIMERGEIGMGGQKGVMKRLMDSHFK